jgi:putative ABC transport system ATP-binding protein
MLRFILSPDVASSERSLDNFADQNHIQHDGSAAIATTKLDLIYESTAQPCHALKSVDLTVKQGDVQMVIGPSGAGKTTLLLVVAGLLTPTRGRVALLGHDLFDMPRHQRDQFRLHHIGILFQESNLLRSLTALENVEAVLKIRGIHGGAARREANELLAAVGLAKWRNHLPRQLSGGQQQRVAVARSMAGAPALIIADEPTASLDSKNGQIVIESMRQLAKERGSTVLIATHDSRILSYADRIAHLDDGVLVED